MKWDWSWNHGNPYMRGWGMVIMLGLCLIIFGYPVWFLIKQFVNDHRRGRGT